MSDRPNGQPSVTVRHEPVQARAAQRVEALLDAAAAVVVEHGIEHLTTALVADRAGASIGTVYRYFPTKEDLLRAVGEFWTTSIDSPRYDTVDDLADTARATFAAFDTVADQIQAAMSTRLGRASNEASRAERTAKVTKLVGGISDHLSEEERLDALAVIRVLHSSRVWKAMRDDFDMDGDSSGRAVAWALRVLIDDVRRRNQAQAAAQDGGDDG